MFVETCDYQRRKRKKCIIEPCTNLVQTDWFALIKSRFQWNTKARDFRFGFMFVFRLWNEFYVKTNHSLRENSLNKVAGKCAKWVLHRHKLKRAFIIPKQNTHAHSSPPPHIYTYLYRNGKSSIHGTSSYEKQIASDPTKAKPI